MSELQEEFLRRACEAARQAGHAWPEYAACEAALESGWGRSQLAAEANNLFGQKQAHPALPDTTTLTLPTKEFLKGKWVNTVADWICFPDWDACFRQRMETLRRLGQSYPAYAAALAASSGEEYVRQVSSRWSTDPERASKVLAIYRAHSSAFLQEETATAPK